MNIAVLASGNGTALQAILDEIENGTLQDVFISKVISNKEDSGALEKARAAGIKALFVDPFGQEPDEYDETLIGVIGEVDLICLVGYLKILTPIFIHKFEGKVINVHPSLLPKYGGKGCFGKNVHKAVLKNGETETGMTIHYVDEGVDSGEVILQKSVAIAQEDNIESLSKKVQELEKIAYPEAIRMIQENR